MLPTQAYLERTREARATALALIYYSATHDGKLPPDPRHPPSIPQQVAADSRSITANGYQFDIDLIGRTQQLPRRDRRQSRPQPVACRTAHCPAAVIACRPTMAGITSPTVQRTDRSIQPFRAGRQFQPQRLCQARKPMGGGCSRRQDGQGRYPGTLRWIVAATDRDYRRFFWIDGQQMRQKFRNRAGE